VALLAPQGAGRMRKRSQDGPSEATG